MSFAFSSARAPLYPKTALLLGLLAVALWSGSTVAEKLLLGSISPFSLIVCQLGASVAVLWAALLAGRPRLPANGALLRLAWPGLLQPGLANTLLLLGLARTDANVFSLLNACETVLMLLFARWLLAERIGRRVGLLAGLATVGAMLVGLGPGTEPGARSGSELELGPLLVMAGTVCAALYGVVCRDSGGAEDAAAVTPLVQVTLQQSAGFLVALLVWLAALPRGEAATLGQVDASTWGWAALAGLFQYALPFWLFLNALRTLKASAAALLLILGPVFVLAAAFFLLGERLSAIQGWGAVLTLLALSGIARRPPEVRVGQALTAGGAEGQAAAGGPRCASGSRSEHGVG
ncbi:DMT family transporter [Deinococcus sp. S9]|uniref:DMT family transporter n=1 Tax=Deinococcus sp. S9 TaxID=2545754 RepID=UPI001404CE19|nr:DMT family transporter [Deinococcus sp. S9]